MKRPEKKVENYLDSSDEEVVFRHGYNQACDDWEAFLPALIEIKKILNDKCRDCKQDINGCQYTCSILANEISKRLEERDG